ncbi:hypothetical protein BU17DRAFT_89176 [Hysterangium stoloniferum]|nr:hypothetical protein BU17DRAFT_89176 [Hysterangium stoloniferum]
MSSSSINLSSLLKVAGDEIIRAYRTKYFTTGIIEASGEFLSINNAINWVNAENFQHFVVEWLQVPTPCTPQIIESSTSATFSGDSQSSEYPPPIIWVTPNKSTGAPAKKHARYSKHQVMTDAGWIQITRQQWVKQLVELTEIPTTWPIPMEGESIGYILNLTNSAFKFIDSNGNPLSMAAIIKNKYERYSDDFKTFEEIHNAQIANNAAEADSVIGVAAA